MGTQSTWGTHSDSMASFCGSFLSFMLFVLIFCTIAAGEYWIFLSVATASLFTLLVLFCLFDENWSEAYIAEGSDTQNSGCYRGDYGSPPAWDETVCRSCVSELVRMVGQQKRQDTSDVCSAHRVWR